MKQFKRSIMLFHRDLRLEDNTALVQAVAQSQEVMLVFIFDRMQVGTVNEYRSSNALEFMVASLEDLAGQVHEKGGKLFFFHGHTQEIIKRLVKEQQIDAVFSNRDYTPFARKRDADLQKQVEHAGATWISCDDALLCSPDKLFTGKGTPYTIYTAFLKKAWELGVQEPKKIGQALFFKGHITDEVQLSSIKRELIIPNSDLFQVGGTHAAHKILSTIGAFKNYTDSRNIPSLKTTGLSAHNKFGTVSIRQVYAACKKERVDKQLIMELYWRDFFTYIGYHNPTVFGHAFVKKYDHIAWSHNKSWFERWCEGTTGFPIVDAGMRQLNATGFMHNRIRMVVASFLTKDMLIDWRWGERYFAQKLTDYDPCVNNGNWQWSASTGADAQPYFRIFSPWLQQKRFDPECIYIKRWIPELEDLSIKPIEQWYKATQSHKGYPVPMFDHGDQSKKAKLLFTAG